MNASEKSDLVTYRLKRSAETLSEIPLHLKNGLWNTAINRLYYACYYAVAALLLEYDIKANTHSGVRQMLGLHFVKTGKIDPDLGKVFSSLFDKRHSSDYDDFIQITKEDIEDLLPPATILIGKIEELIKEK
jgi:uncharacterized protein (UPF0332 family)